VLLLLLPAGAMPPFLSPSWGMWEARALHIHDRRIEGLGRSYVQYCIHDATSEVPGRDDGFGGGGAISVTLLKDAIPPSGRQGPCKRMCMATHAGTREWQQNTDHPACNRHIPSGGNGKRRPGCHPPGGGGNPCRAHITLEQLHGQVAWRIHVSCPNPHTSSFHHMRQYAKHNCPSFWPAVP
jgi:hypothetical protein